MGYAFRLSTKSYSRANFSIFVFTISPHYYEGASDKGHRRKAYGNAAADAKPKPDY